MTPKKKSKPSRQGVRAEGKTATSISLSKEPLEQARVAAVEDGRTFSNWIEQQIKDALKAAGKISLLAFAAFHLTCSPLDWHAEALAASFSKAVSLIASLS